MTKREFDLLTALEKTREVAEVKELAAFAGLSIEEAALQLEALTEQGLVCCGRITEAGLNALEPYKTRRAIFIAAGFGSRLRPVTLEIAKPLVKVNGTRIIDTLIDGALAAGSKVIQTSLLDFLR